MNENRLQSLVRETALVGGVPPQDVEIVRSPYRVCPLGAHVDHQLGNVTGMALERALLFAFVPRADSLVRVQSRNFPAEIAFRLEHCPDHPPGDWGDYLRGAVAALRRGYGVGRGLFGIVDGYSKVGGLSSSAAVGVAYLLALERSNDLDLGPLENIELDRLIENEYIGLNNGILDQSTILLSRRDRLLHLDCRTASSQLHECGSQAQLWIAILYSGLSEQLCDTDYNRRVAECEEAARLLLQRGKAAPIDSPKLRDVPPELFDKSGSALPDALRRRAEHFFSEQRRVAEGVQLWETGDLEGFGRLISESGRSSVENYECGNEYLRSAFHVLRDTPGVLGARFSGAGFRGCSIGLMKGPPDEDLGRDMLRRYLEVHPDMQGKADVVFCRTGDGARVFRQQQGCGEPPHEAKSR